VVPQPVHRSAAVACTIGPRQSGHWSRASSAGATGRSSTGPGGSRSGRRLSKPWAQMTANA